MKLTVRFFLIVAACAQDANDARSINSAGCGKRITDMDPTHVKVVGGQRADPEDWGWQVMQ